MGQRLSSSSNRQDTTSTTGSSGVTIRNKRRLENESDDAESSIASNTEKPADVGLAPFSDFHTPKRKRMKSTSKYIYQTLFLDGENSDVTIFALGREWKLHKVYLSQSPYFACMFNGSWREAHQRVVELDIPDPAIDYTALKIALGSLYRDYVFLKPVEVIGVLAAANLLQLDGLIQQCVTLMSNTIGSETVCCYYDASGTYSIDSVHRECFKWLLTNLLVSTDIQLFKQITVDLMSKLIGHHELFVMQVEMDIYSLLKKWVFLRENPSWAGTNVDLLAAIETYFKDATSSNCYLETEEGKKYLQPFQKIKWQHILIDMESINVLENDRVINMDWIQPVYKHLWRQMLNVEQGKDKGCEKLPEEKIYNKLAMRCGRVLKKEEEYCWRWVGYSYGIDLLLTYGNRIFTIKRNTLSQQSPHSISLEKARNIIYRLTAASVDQSGKTIHVKSTEMEHISLGKDEEHLAVTLDKNFTFPLYLSMSMMITSPTHCLSQNIEFGDIEKQMLHSFTQTEKVTSQSISTQVNTANQNDPDIISCKQLLDHRYQDLYSIADLKDTISSSHTGSENVQEQIKVIYREKIILAPNLSQGGKQNIPEREQVSYVNTGSKESPGNKVQVIDIPSSASPKESIQQPDIANKKKGSFRLHISPRRQLRYIDEDDEV